MRKIEPGMLCLVTSGHNMGRECTTLRLVQPGERLPEVESARSGPQFVGTEGGVKWLVQGPNIHIRRGTIMGDWSVIYEGGYGLVQPHHLLPIQPDQQLHMTEVKKLKVPHDARELTTT